MAGREEALRVDQRGHDGENELGVVLTREVYQAVPRQL